MVKFRIFLIAYLVKLATKNFLKNYNLIVSGKYNNELILQDNKGLAESLQNFCYNNIFPNRDITSLELTGHSVISGLLDIYTGFVFHKNKDYRERAAGLISDSIIRVAIEENKFEIIEKRFNQIIEKLDKETDQIKKNKIKDSLDKVEELKKELPFIEKGENPKDIKDKILEFDKKFYKTIKPKLDDLSDYYKLRVIVDYISGMTDQFALSQYQKLSGQKIS